MNCELDAITLATIASCDKFDGIVDGVISDFKSCRAKFDPSRLIGTSIQCAQTGKTERISAGAVAVVKATWAGPVTAAGERLRVRLQSGCWRDG